MGLGGAGGRQRAPQAGRSLWAAERPLDRTSNRNPARPSSAWPAFGRASRSLTRHSHACPGASSRGGGAPHPPAAPSHMPRAPRGAQVDPAVSVSHPGPGQDAGQGRGAGRGARRVLPRAPAGVPAPGLRHSGSGSGAQAVPGGGALESGLEFSPNTQAAGWAAAVGSGSRPGRRCGRWVRAQGDQGAADLEPCLEADREISVPRGFGRRM